MKKYIVALVCMIIRGTYAEKLIVVYVYLQEIRRNKEKETRELESGVFIY